MDDTPSKPPRDASADTQNPDDTIVVEEKHAASDGDDDDNDNAGRETGDEGDDAAADHRPRYRSWKKKWRKLRITFDDKMHEAEVLWMQEQKARATIKRIAIENDRLLDLLTDINVSGQIPPEKRILVPTASTPEPRAPSPSLPGRPSKSLSALESEVPHMSLAQASESLPDFLHDVTPAPGEDDPAPFLTVDEIEDYLFEVDRRIGLPKQATLAPLSREGAPQRGGSAAAAVASAAVGAGAAATTSSATRDFLLRHPHSAYNWLKVNAPHVFLQGGVGEDEDGKARAKGDKGHAKAAASGSRGAASKRQSKADKAAAREREREREQQEAPAVDEALGEGAAGALGKKRKRDTGDAGYRPKGGSGSRQTKKKRKSEGGAGGGPEKRRKVGVEKGEQG